MHMDVEVEDLLLTYPVPRVSRETNFPATSQ
jgi:hypothetical protein